MGGVYTINKNNHQLMGYYCFNHIKTQVISAAPAAPPGRLPTASGRSPAAPGSLDTALDDAPRRGGVRPVPGTQAR